MIINIDPVHDFEFFGGRWIWIFVQGNQVQSQGLKSDMQLIINIDPSRGVKKY